jgi:hypothetical protein
VSSSGSRGEGGGCTDRPNGVGSETARSGHDLGARSAARALERGRPVTHFEPIGSDTFSDSVEALAREGVLVAPGAVGNPTVSLNLWALMGKRGPIQGSGTAQASRETMERLISVAGEGKLEPVIDRELPLEQASDAHRAIGSARDLRESHLATLGPVTVRVSRNALAPIAREREESIRLAIRGAAGENHRVETN